MHFSNRFPITNLDRKFLWSSLMFFEENTKENQLKRRGFGNVILIIVKIGELLIWISPRIVYACEKLYQRLERATDFQIPRCWLKKNTHCQSFIQPTSSFWKWNETPFLGFYYLPHLPQLRGHPWFIHGFFLHSPIFAQMGHCVSSVSLHTLGRLLA